MFFVYVLLTLCIVSKAGEFHKKNEKSNKLVNNAAQKVKNNRKLHARKSRKLLVGAALGAAMKFAKDMMMKGKLREQLVQLKQQHLDIQSKNNVLNGKITTAHNDFDRTYSNLKENVRKYVGLLNFDMRTLKTDIETAMNKLE